MKLDTVLNVRRLRAGVVAAISAFSLSAALAQEPDWMLDPRPYAERTTRLYEIAVHRFVPEAATGVVLERRSLLTATGLIARVEDARVPASVTIPEAAYNKLLVSASTWIAYGRLGPQALANFRLVNDLEPIDIAGRWHYEVALAERPRGNVGAVPNLSSRGEVTPTAPLIGGFVVEELPRRVLIRAVGPGLLPFGVGNALTAAKLQVYLGDLRLIANEGWSDSAPQRTLVEAATAEAGAFPLAVGSKDAAIVHILPPGAYTAHASGATPAAGAVLLEVYILD
jgi:hypothetical protein